MERQTIFLEGKMMKTLIRLQIKANPIKILIGFCRQAEILFQNLSLQLPRTLKEKRMMSTDFSITKYYTEI